MNFKIFVRKLLVDLGDGPVDIAANLGKWQIKGVVRDDYQCPLANHLTTQLSLNGFPAIYVSVLSSAILFFDKNKTEESGFIDYLNLPSQVESFVRKFDDGSFKELELSA